MLNLHVKKLSYKNILTQVNFEWSQGEKLALMGANGSGKSTLAKLLAGQIKADAGELEVYHNGEKYLNTRSRLSAKRPGQLWITHDPEVALRADRLLVLQERRTMFKVWNTKSIQFF